MKIAVITYSDTDDNYGQILQCYALQFYLKELGHDVYLIQYNPTKLSYKDKIVSTIKSLHKLLSISKVRYFLSAERKRYIDINNKLCDLNHKLNKGRRFEFFKDKYISKTDCIYNSISELRKNPPQADIYICGSDQIWGGRFEMSNTAGWFLDFGDISTTRISYAASMGGKQLDNIDVKILKKYLRNFKTISVRESTSKLSCSMAGFKETSTVLDPTMLIPLDGYKKLFTDAEIKINSRYIFLYILNVENRKDIHWDDIAVYSSSRNLEIKAVYSSGYIPARELCPGIIGLQATIPEWLAYIYNAESVITTSFHGIVFCIKMNKPFLAILLNNNHSAGNVRITELLSSLNLNERIYNPSISIEEQTLREINWTDVNCRLNKYLSSSTDFLNRAICTTDY